MADVTYIRNGQTKVLPASYPKERLLNKGWEVKGEKTPESPLRALRDQAQMLGVDVKPNWGEKKLREEIEKAAP